MALIPDYGKIKQNRIDEAPELVLKKIKRIYKILDVEPTAEEKRIKEQMAAQVTRFMENSDGEGWDPKKSVKEDGLALDDQETAKLKKLSADFIGKAIDSMAMSNKINDLFTSGDVTNLELLRTDPENIKMQEGGRFIPHRYIHSEYPGTKDLLDSYSSQLVRSTFLNIKALGFSGEQSYKICGNLVKNSMIIYLNYHKGKGCNFSPERILGSIENNIDIVMTFPESRKNKLIDQKRKYTERLKEEKDNETSLQSANLCLFP